MSNITKQIVFVITGIVLVGIMGIWNEVAVRLLGMFALGWMLQDIARTVFPENK